MPTSQNFELAPSADETTSLLEQQKLTTPVSSDTTKLTSSRDWRALIAFLLALTCCGCANSITLFPMFAPGFQHTLGFSPFQINSISIASSLGMYLPVPILGFIADRLGPGNLGIISIALFTPAYLAAAHISQLAPHEAAEYYHVLMAAFASIGTATSALYFSGVITCARTMPKSPGLAISTPVAFFGLSSLWQSQVLQKLFIDTDGGIDLASAFKFFAVLYFIAGLVAYIGSTVIGRVFGSDSPSQIGEVADSTDNEQLKVATSESGESNSYGTLASSEDDLIYKRHENVGQFLRDRTVWIMFLAFILTSGPLEMYLNDMGMILSTVPSGPTVSTNVSLFSAFSTLARLSTGIFSDLVKDRIARPTILVFILFLTALLNFLIASGIFTELENGRYFFLSSSGIGFSYGAVYTLIPTIVACTWGVENLGTHWGIFITAPALGSTGFGYLFAKVYDAASSSVSNLKLVSAMASDPPAVATCSGRACYEFTFLISGTSVVTSALLVSAVWLFVWKKPRRQLA